MTAWMKTPKDLAETIVAMGYGDLLQVASEIYEMNAGENKGVRDMDTKYGVADTLFDWAEATIEEIASVEAAASRDPQ